MKKIILLLLVVIFSGFVFSACTSSEPVPTETINQELQDERSSFDDKRGNNLQSAKTAQTLVDLSKTVAPGYSFDVYINADAGEVENKKYELGGNETEYKNNVDWVVLSIVIDSDLWNTYSEDSKKDLVASWITIMQNEYPSGSGMVTVSNSSRKVVEGSWIPAEYNSEPKIELK